MSDELIVNNSKEETCDMLQEYEGGVYVAGIDIPLGGYVFTAIEKQGTVKIYARYKDYLSDRPVDALTTHKNETYVSLREEGMVVKVCSCIMKKELSVLERIEVERKKKVEAFLLETTETHSEEATDNTGERPT